MTFAMATHNAHKLEELARILRPLGVQVTPAEYREVEETGGTFAENARLKAQAACRDTGLPCVADDSGLMVDALGGAPGVYSARYAGEHATDAQRIEKLLREMETIPEEKRAARFVSAICCAFPDGRTLETEGVCEGSVARAPSGAGGFGYDPVFCVGGKTYAEMSAEEKDAVSHRGKALRAFAALLQESGVLNGEGKEGDAC